MVEERENEIEDAKFNMALDTLKRLGNILFEIKQLSFNDEFTDSGKQIIKINLVKQFFLQSSPLLPKTIVGEFKKEILNLKPKMIRIGEKSSYGAVNFIGSEPAFNWVLEIRLDELLIELQGKLQEQKYFMPPAESEDMY